MTPRSCRSPLPWPALVGYWLSDPEVPAEDVESHLFGCAECSRALANLAGLTAALRRRFGGETLQPVVTRAALAGLVAGGLRVVETVVPRGERKTVAIPGDVDLVAACLPADLTDAERVDVEICAPDGVPFFVVRDAPFDAGSGEVLVLCHRHTAASNPALLLRLTATYAGERTAVSEHALVSAIE